MFDLLSECEVKFKNKNLCFACKPNIIRGIKND